MALALVQAKLDNLMNSMFAMDILGDYYKELEGLEAGKPSFLAEFIPLYGNEFQKNLSLVSKVLGEPVVDFSKLDELSTMILEESLYMGADKVVMACKKFRNVCKAKDKEGCVKAMHEVKSEFDVLYKKLLTMLELKQLINALDSQKIIGLSKL